MFQNWNNASVSYELTRSWNKSRKFWELFCISFASTLLLLDRLQPRWGLIQKGQGENRFAVTIYYNYLNRRYWIPSEKFRISICCLHFFRDIQISNPTTFQSLDEGNLFKSFWFFMCFNRSTVPGSFTTNLKPINNQKNMLVSLWLLDSMATLKICLTWTYMTICVRWELIRYCK